MTRLHLTTASMSWRDPDPQVRADFSASLSRGAHFVGYTEVYNNLPILEEEARQHNYTLHWGPTRKGKAETVIAVKKRIKVRRTVSILVNPADPGKPPHSGHSARYLTGVIAEWRGNVIAVCEAHWVTRGGKGERVSRKEKRRRMSQAVASFVERHGEGARIAFFMGDTNESDERDNEGSVIYEPLEQSDLVTVWDELGAYPPTHGPNSTIDIIGSYDRDKRVKAIRAVAHRGQYSDHRQVSAIYEVRGKR